MIFEFKGHKLSNSLSVFNYYKMVVGRSLERDIRAMQKYHKVMDDENATEDEVDKVLQSIPSDPIEIIQNLYFAMRCAAEQKFLDMGLVNDEVTLDDLTDGSLQDAIIKLVDVKKKDPLPSQSQKATT